MPAKAVLYPNCISISLFALFSMRSVIPFLRGFIARTLSCGRYASHWLTLTLWGCYGLCLRHKPTERAHSFYSGLVSVSVFIALSTVFHSINSPDNSPLSHSVFLVLFLPDLSFQYIFLYENLPQP